MISTSRCSEQHDFLIDRILAQKATLDEPSLLYYCVQSEKAQILRSIYCDVWNFKHRDEFSVPLQLTPQNPCCCTKLTREMDLLMVWWTCSCFSFCQKKNRPRLRQQLSDSELKMSNAGHVCRVNISLHNSLIYNRLYCLPCRDSVCTCISHWSTRADKQ